MGQAQSIPSSVVNTTVNTISSSVNIARGFLEPARFSGLVVGALDFTETNNQTTNVEFTNSPTVSGNRKAVFMKNVTESQSIFGNGFIRGLKVTDPVSELEEMKKRGKIPLFCIHGWQGRPDIWLSGCNKVKDKFLKETRYELVPVLWPANGNNSFPRELVPFPVAVDYLGSREDAASAAEVLKEAFTSIKDQQKSVLGVSMGTWFLQELAALDNSEELNFDDIFLSAADLDETVFDNDVGKNIIKMISTSDENENGKVYVMHNANDTILQLSTFANTATNNGTRRLGLDGAIGGNGPRLKNVDVTVKQRELGRGRSHGYLFEDYIIEFYEKKNLATE